MERRKTEGEAQHFLPRYLPTINFGKRDIDKQNKYKKIMWLLLQNSPQRYPIDT